VPGEVEYFVVLALPMVGKLSLEVVAHFVSSPCRYLTNDGIEHLRTYLNLPSEIVPATLKKSARPPSRPLGGAGGERPPRGPPREGERPRFGGDREGYRSSGGRGGGFGGEKGGAPGEYRPEFRGGRGGFGRGGGSFSGGAPGAITE